MKYLKLLLKIVLGIVGVLILIIFVLLNAESYKIVNKNIGNEIINVEIKKVFGKKISECSTDAFGLYHGQATSWSLFGNTIRNEGSYKNGYWHGQWKDYDRNGNLTMVRKWNMGKLNKVFLPEGSSLKEVPKENWPKYVDVRQHKPQRINE